MNLSSPPHSEALLRTSSQAAAVTGEFDLATDELAALPPAIRAALEQRGFESLTAVQRAVLDVEAQGRNLRISSQTGSGKTVALGMVIAEDLFERRPGVQALVITPTRELATQVRDELRWLFAELPGVRVEAVTGGTDMGRERMALRRAPSVLVATPGRLLDHLRRDHVQCGELRQLVLDEADRMLDMGFREELEAILDALPAERRTHLVSATFPPQVQRLADRAQPDAIAITGTTLGSANADIEHCAALVDRNDTYGAIVNTLLLAHRERVLVFVERRHEVAELADRLTQDGFTATSLSGDLSQAQRTRALEAFRSGAADVLVSTDVAARGIDVAGISLVIHADLPNDADSYTHRSGRTGRAGRSGRSLLLVPVRAEARARHLLRSARVEATWTTIPGVEEIHAAVRERGRRAVEAQLAERADDDALADARALLDGRDPAQVVAALLQLATPALPCEPRAVKRIGAGRDERRPVRAKSVRHAGKFVRFSINWGHRKGATPSRILSHVCRRGDIDSGLVGAIEIGARVATFDIAEPVAGGFEERVRVPDAREPGLRIARREQ